MQKSQRLVDKVVIVTGAAQGIGLVTAQAVAASGGTAILTDLNEAQVQKEAKSLQQDGSSAEGHQLNVLEAEAFERLAQDVLARHGRIDGLVNNAGINVKYQPLEMPPSEWDRCLDVNVRGQWHGCKAVLPTMLRQGAGSIVNMSSTHGHQIIPASFPYPVSKAAVLGLTRALGVEYAPRGVRVNSISPGYVETPLLDQWLADVPDPVATRRDAEALIPARRFARPEEVGLTAVFLLSDEAPYITATDIAVDGGRLALFHA